MQVPNYEEAASINPQTPQDPEPSNSNSTVDDDDDDTPAAADESLILDVSGKCLDSIGESSGDGVRALYLYMNVYNLLPKSVGRLKRLRTMKFFRNEINLFSSLEFGNLVGLECLQLRLSSSAFDGLSLRSLRGLKELELSKVPWRSSAIQILSEIAKESNETQIFQFGGKGDLFSSFSILQHIRERTSLFSDYNSNFFNWSLTNVSSFLHHSPPLPHRWRSPFGEFLSCSKRTSSNIMK